MSDTVSRYESLMVEAENQGKELAIYSGAIMLLEVQTTSELAGLDQEKNPARFEELTEKVQQLGRLKKRFREMLTQNAELRSFESVMRTAFVNLTEAQANSTAILEDVAKLINEASVSLTKDYLDGEPVPLDTIREVYNSMVQTLEDVKRTDVEGRATRESLLSRLPNNPPA